VGLPENADHAALDVRATVHVRGLPARPACKSLRTVRRGRYAVDVDPLAFGHHEDRTPTHASAATRALNALVRRSDSSRNSGASADTRSGMVLSYLMAVGAANFGHARIR
jgi:hypothetical protein